MNQKVTIYTAGPSCGACIASKSSLRRHDIEFEEVDLTKNPEALAMVKGLGYERAPVTFRTDPATDHVLEHWGGYRLDKIKATAAMDQAPSGASPPWPPLGQQVSGPRGGIQDTDVLAHVQRRELNLEHAAIDIH